MNNKGFTMVELIMVILILGILALLATPNVLKMLERNKRNDYNDTIDSIIEASKLYASDNRYNLQFVDENGNATFCKPDDDNDIYTTITLNDLVNSKNLSSPIKNSCTNDNLDLNTISVKITLSCSNNTFIDYSVIGLTKKEDVTDNNGKINEGYFCNDLY